MVAAEVNILQLYSADLWGHRFFHPRRGPLLKLRCTFEAGSLMAVGGNFASLLHCDGQILPLSRDPIIQR